MNKRILVMFVFVIVAFLALSTACNQVPVAPIVVIPEKETPKPTETAIPTLAPTETLVPTEIPTLTITPTSTLTERQIKDAARVEMFEFYKELYEQDLERYVGNYIEKHESYGYSYKDFDLKYTIDENGKTRELEYFKTLNLVYKPQGTTEEDRDQHLLNSIGFDEVTRTGDWGKPLSLWTEWQMKKWEFLQHVIGPNDHFEIIKDSTYTRLSSSGEIIYKPFTVDTSRIGKLIEEPHAIKEVGVGFRFITAGNIAFELLCEYPGDINVEVTPMKCSIISKKGGAVIRELHFTTTSDAMFEIGICAGNDPNACASGGKGYYLASVLPFFPSANEFTLPVAFNAEGKTFYIASKFAISMTLNGNWVFVSDYLHADWCQKSTYDRNVLRYDFFNYYDFEPRIEEGVEYLFLVTEDNPIWVTIDHTERCPVIIPIEE